MAFQMKLTFFALAIILISYGTDAQSCSWIKYENTDSEGHSNWGDKCFGCEVEDCKSFCAQHDQCTGFSTFHDNCYYRNSTSLKEDMEISVFNVNADGVDLYVKSICDDLECGATDNKTTCDLVKFNLKFPDTKSTLHVVNCKGEEITTTYKMTVGEQIELMCKDEYAEWGDEKQTKGDRTITECQENGRLTTDWNIKHLEARHLHCGGTSANSLNCGSGSSATCSLSDITLPSTDLHMQVQDCEDTVLTTGGLKTDQQIQLSCKEGYAQSGHGNGTITSCKSDGSIPGFDYDALIAGNAIHCISTSDDLITTSEKEKSGNSTSTLFEGFAADSSSASANSWSGQFVFITIGCVVAAIAVTVYKQRSQRREDGSRQELATLVTPAEEEA
ncbi:hypothetical protein CYMTET_36196 [Cymbomonas tetramitiformis]|uniref:Uncharacterized protein n=1 Tax=Cymbomonas tetramitiformis TaxID=36881 RepID=A0AAE0CGH2_9CHLO|nr:hypothetical protein CYMTET_36196 [Cymbomonas tetramitiformis]